MTPRISRFLWESDGWDDWEFDPDKPWLPPKPKKKVAVVKDPPPPEAPKDAPFGEYLFGWMRKNVYEENIQEEDSPEEKRLIAALGNYYSWNNRDGLEKMVDLMWKMKEQGWYRKFFQVREGYAWRVLFGIQEDYLRRLTGLTTPGKEGVVRGAIMSPRAGNNITSWSMREESMPKLFGQVRMEGDIPKGFVVLGRCKTEENSFFFNMFEAAKYLEVGEDTYEYQQEVLAKGSVTCDALAYVFLENTRENPMRKLSGMLSSGTLPEEGSKGDSIREILFPLGESGPSYQGVFPSLGDTRVSRAGDAAEDRGMLNIADRLGLDDDAHAPLSGLFTETTRPRKKK